VALEKDLGRCHRATDGQAKDKHEKMITETRNQKENNGKKKNFEGES